MYVATEVQTFSHRILKIMCKHLCIKDWLQKVYAYCLNLLIYRRQLFKQEVKLCVCVHQCVL